MKEYQKPYIEIVCFATEKITSAGVPGTEGSDTSNEFDKDGEGFA